MAKSCRHHLSLRQVERMVAVASTQSEEHKVPSRSLFLPPQLPELAGRRLRLSSSGFLSAPEVNTLCGVPQEHPLMSSRDACDSAGLWRNHPLWRPGKRYAWTRSLPLKLEGAYQNPTTGVAGRECKTKTPLYSLLKSQRLVL